MKNRFILFCKRIFSRIAFCIFDIKYLIEQIEKEKVKESSKQVILGKASLFYPEAIVENISNDVNKIIIGEGTHIRGELTVYGYAKQLIIGSNSYIGKWTVIRVGEYIYIGDNVLISHNVSIIDSDSHELDALERAIGYKEMVNRGHSNLVGNIKTSPIIIKNHVWINYGVSILKGVTIGEGAVVGAGSVVTRDVDAWTVVAGNPAKVIKILKKPGEM